MRFPLKICLLLSSLCITNCGKSRERPLRVSIPDGSYSVAGPFCRSTMVAPLFPNANAMASLYVFSDTEYTLEINGFQARQIFQTTNCSFILERELATNFEGYFAFREKRLPQTEPADCALTARHDDTTFPYDSNHPLLNKQESTKVELLFQAQHTPENNPNEYTLTTLGSESERTLWREFGCAFKDQIVYKLTLK